MRSDTLCLSARAAVRATLDAGASRRDESAHPLPRPRGLRGREPEHCQVQDINGRNQSRLWVRLSLRRGRLFVEPGHARFFPSNAYRNNSTLTSSAVERLLVADLNRAFSELNFFDTYALPFPPAPPTAPDEPAEDASEAEKEKYKVERQKYETELSDYQGKVRRLNDASNDPQLTREVRGFNGSWADFAITTGDGKARPFINWRKAALANERLRGAYADLGITLEVPGGAEAEAAKTIFEAPDVLDAAIISAALPPKLSRLALIGDTEITLPDPADPLNQISFNTLDTRAGTVCFRVSDPVKSYASVPESEKAFIERAVRRWRLEGKPWRPALLQAALAEYYDERGIGMTPLASDNDRAQTLSALRWQIDRIFVPQLAEDEREFVLYTSLPAGAYREFRRNRRATSERQYLMPFANPLGGGDQWLIDFRNEGEPDEAGDRFKRLAIGGDGLYFYASRALRIQEALAGAGYTMTVEGPRDDPAHRASYVDLIIKKSGGGAPPPQGAISPTEDRRAVPAPTPAPPLATPPSPFASPPSPTPSPQLSTGNLIKFCQGHNFVGGGFEYKPDQGVRGFGVYECRRLGDGHLSLRFGGHGRPFGDVSYSKRFRPFNSPREATVGFHGAAEFEARRFLDGFRTDERRKGASLSLDLPLSAPYTPGQFSLFVEGRRETIELIREEKTVAKQNLTTLLFGFNYSLDRTASPRPTMLTLRSQLNFGLGASHDEPRFTLFTLAGHTHTEATRLVVFDLAGRLGVASRGTPVFEQPSFGGEDFVRGFRRDDAIGLRAWSLQPELWLRLRGFGTPAYINANGSGRSRVGGLIRSLRESLSLSTFFDVGGLYRTTSSRPGARSGPGVGLRYDFKQAGRKVATFKLDWAYGLGEGATGRGRGRFYFTVSSSDHPF